MKWSAAKLKRAPGLVLGALGSLFFLSQPGLAQTNQTILIGQTVLIGQTELIGDVLAGQRKAVLCTLCHGPAGVSANPSMPSLAGQQQQYLANQIKAFKIGLRAEDTMYPYVQGLSDQDIADLAVYYAALPPRW